MSGICGIYNLDGAPVDLPVLRLMVAAAAHRGPDGSGCWAQNHVGLGHLALNLTPESINETQPLVSRTGDAVLVADARIDNRDDLVRLLGAGGYLAGPEPTDADLILAAYRCKGADCAGLLIGDFAFVLWDNARQQLFAARDAMGMRALYYRREARRLLFATEVKQILAAPGVPAQPFEPAIGAYLAGYEGPLDWTFYAGIAQLPPASALLVSATTWRTWRFWAIDPEYRIEYADEEQYAEHFLALFTEAVRCRLRVRRPAGIFLSGGLDSGSIAAVAGTLLRQDGQAQPLHTYSFAFDELPQCDERHISAGIVAHFGLSSTDVPADLLWPLRDYPAHGPDRDDPVLGVYQALIEHTLVAARDAGIGVMFGGDRGDLMMGCGIFDILGLLHARQWAALWNELREYGYWHGRPIRDVAVAFLLRPMWDSLWPRGHAEPLRRHVRRLYFAARGRQPPRPPWMRAAFAKRIDLDEIIQQSSPLPNVVGFARRQRYEAIFSHMHMRGAVWTERTAARFGLAPADPWSDRRIASFALAVPPRVLNREGEHKRLTRVAMRGIMPEHVRRAACKIAPTPLFHLALKHKARATVLDLLQNSRAGTREYLDEQELRGYYEAFCLNQGEDHRFWYALALEMWLRQHQR
jgi:asparagine synthase (glutamine-hydrolysing)